MIRVVCVDASVSGRLLADGAVYEITLRDGRYCQLRETGPRKFWFADRFRPFRSTETGMAILRDVAAHAGKRRVDA